MKLRKGFTLIELLVVISIISLLISMLLPALASARSSGRTVQCATNMRSIGQAIDNYAVDYKSLLPYGWFGLPTVAGNPQIISWDDLINSYIGGNASKADIELFCMPTAIALFQCPEDIEDRSLGYFKYRTRSYSLVQNSCNPGGWPSFNFAGIATFENIYAAGWGVNTYFKCVSTGEIQAPSQTLVSVENPQNSAINVNALNILGHGAGAVMDRPIDQGWIGSTPLHKGRWNYHFADGHVNTMQEEDTVRAPATTQSYGYSATPLNYMWTRLAGD